MSTRAKGNRREDAVCRALEAFGYRTMCARASGSKSVRERPAGALSGDFVAIAPEDSGLPHLLGECGGVGKRLGTTFAELTARPLPPGFVPFVARCIARRWAYNLSEDERFTDLGEALDVLRSRA